MNFLRRSRHAALGLLFLAVFGASSRAQIESLTLDEMVQLADDAVYGEVVARHVFRVDSQVDGPELYFTRLSVQGRSLSDARAAIVELTFRGGFVGPGQGVFNSVAPAAADVAVGQRVVAFYRWTDDMGGGVAGNALVAAHGGLYRTAEGPRGTAVLGRGAGYAVGANVRLGQLETAIGVLRRRNAGGAR